MFESYKVIEAKNVKMIINCMVRTNCYHWAENKWSEENFQQVYEAIIDKVMADKGSPFNNKRVASSRVVSAWVASARVVSARAASARVPSAKPELVKKPEGKFKK